MNWLASIFLSFLTGALGLVCAGMVAAACVKWYRISSFEGGSGYFVILISFLGGVAGLVIGLVAARLVAAGASPGFLKALGASWGTVFAITAVAALLSHALADIPPTLDGRELTLEVEVRLPAGAPRPVANEKGETFVELNSVVRHVAPKVEARPVVSEKARLEDGRWIVPGEMELFTKRGLRSVGFLLNGESVDGFIVPMPAQPGPRHEEWSDWIPRPLAPNPPWPVTKPSYRFRVVRDPIPPPQPSPAELKAKQAAEEEAEFRAIPADAPIPAWFAYTRYGAPDERRAVAVSKIIAKPDHIAELAALMVDDNAETAAEALYLVEHLPEPAAHIPAVTEAGRQLAGLMRRVNAAQAEQDPGYEGAAQVSIRFSAWMAAVRPLREKAGGDFIPELREILELSRVRTDSHAMQQDVRRVASYYAQQWAGIAPQPGDPPPR